MWNGGFQINQEVRRLYERHHQAEQFHICLVVSVREVPHCLVVRHEDIYALENRAVLDDDIIGMGDFQNILETLRQEIDFQVERPSLDVLIVIFKIRIICNRLILRRPAIMFRQHTGQCRLAAADISCYSNVHIMKVSRFAKLRLFFNFA